MSFWISFGFALHVLNQRCFERTKCNESRAGLLQSAMAYATGDRSRMLLGLGGVVKTFMNQGKAEKANEYSKQTNTAPCDAISLSGCKDDQTSADSKENGTALVL